RSVDRDVRVAAAVWRHTADLGERDAIIIRTVEGRAGRRGAVRPRHEDAVGRDGALDGDAWLARLDELRDRMRSEREGRGGVDVRDADEGEGEEREDDDGSSQGWASVADEGGRT